MGSMKMKFLLVAMAAVLLITALAGWQTRSAVLEGFRFDAARLKDKNLWTPVNAQPYYISASVDALCRAPTREDYESERTRNPHAASFITVYVNNVGRQAMFSKEPRQFPEGSVIVKEKVGVYVENRAPLLYTIMIKREPGYNPTVGDWEFAVASADGTRIEASGKLGNCQACHISKADSDFVFRPYLKFD